MDGLNMITFQTFMEIFHLSCSHRAIVNRWLMSCRCCALTTAAVIATKIVGTAGLCFCSYSQGVKLRISLIK